MSWEGEFERIRAEEPVQAERLAAYLAGRFSPGSVVDFGCADGLYLVPFARLGVDAAGIEINKEAVAAKRVDKVFLQDLSVPFRLIGKADLSLCLEVFEHIGAEYLLVAVANVAQGADRLIFSAARPGQGGLFHVSCREKEEWRELLQVEDFYENVVETGKLVAHMQAGPHLGWLTQNVMVMERRVR